MFLMNGNVILIGKKFFIGIVIIIITYAQSSPMHFIYFQHYIFVCKHPQTRLQWICGAFLDQILINYLQRNTRSSAFLTLGWTFEALRENLKLGRELEKLDLVFVFQHGPCCPNQPRWHSYFLTYPKLLDVIWRCISKKFHTCLWCFVFVISNFAWLIWMKNVKLTVKRSKFNEKFHWKFYKNVWCQYREFLSQSQHWNYLNLLPFN